MRLAFVILAGLLVAPRARAQESEPADEQRARELFRAGSELYEQAHYAAAIERFEEAYRLSLRPGLLFNIAQAYRLEGPTFCATALQYYERDLDAEPEASNRTEVEELAEEMRLCAAATLATPQAVPAPVLAVTRAEPPPPSRWPVWGAATGATVAVVGLGGYVASWVKFSSVRGAAPYPAGRFRGWETLTRASVATMAGGAALTAVSLAVLLGRRDRLAVTIGPAALTLAGRF